MLIKKSISKKLSIILTLVMMFSLLAPAFSFAATKEITVTANDVYVLKGKTAKASVKVSPSSAKKTYESADEDIATVSSSGVIKGISEGETEITVTATKSGYEEATATFMVYVGSEIEIDANDVRVVKGKTVKAEVTTNPSGAKLSYRSGSTKIATVSSKGVIKGIKNGETEITVTATKTGCITSKATFVVTVGDALDMELTAEDVTVEKGKTANAVVDIDTEGATLSFKSKKTSIAKVDSDGVITGVKTGETTITVTATKAGYNTATATFDVTVVDEIVVEEVEIADIDDQTVEVGKTIDVTVETDPDDAIVYVISDADDKAIVTADGHTLTITGVAAGEANIEVTAAMDGMTEGTTEFKVTVTAVAGVTVTDIIGVTNTTAEVTLSQVPETAPVAADFTFDNGLTVSAVELKTGTTSTYTLTTSPQDSTKTYALSYKGVDTGKSFPGVALAVTSVTVVNVTTVEATLAEVQALVPAADKFVVKVGEDVVPVTGVMLKAGTTQTYTLTVNMDGKEGVVSVNDKAATAASDYKKPSVTAVEVIDSKQLRIKFSEKVNSAAFPVGTSFKLMNRSNNAVATFTTATTLAVEEGATSAILTIGETSGFANILVDFDTSVPNNSVLELIDGSYRLYVSDVKDVADNTIVTNSQADFTVNASDLADKTAPTMVPATYNTASGKLVVSFSEAVKTGTDFDVTKFSITSGTEVIAQLSALDQVTLAGDNKSATIQLTATNITAVRNAINAGNVVRVSAAAGAYKDVAGNSNAAASVSITVAAPPVMTAAQYDEEAHILTVTFDKAVVPSTIVLGLLDNLKLNFEGAAEQNMKDATILSTTDPKAVRLYKTELNEVNNDTTPAHTITLPENLIYTSTDTATRVGNAANTTLNNSLTYTEVTGAPILTGATFNNSTKKLELTFDKNIASGNAAIDETKIDIVKNAGITTGTDIEALVYSIATDADLAVVSGNKVTITLLDTTAGVLGTTVANLINAVNDATALSIKLEASAVKGSNTAFSLATTSAILVTTQPYVTVSATDATKPIVSAADVVSSQVIRVTFSEKVNVVDATNVANYAVSLTVDSNAILPISSVQLDSTGKVATVILSQAQQPGVNYTLKVSGIKDNAGNLMDAYTRTGITGTEGSTNPALVAGVDDKVSVTDADSSQNLSNNDYIILTFNSPVKLTNGTTDYTQVSAITDSTKLAAALVIGGINSALIDNVNTQLTEADVLDGATLTSVSGDNTKLKLTLAKITANKGWNALTIGTSTVNIQATNNIVSTIDNSQATAAGTAQIIVAPITTGPKVVSAVYSDSNSTGEQDKGDKVVVTFDQNIVVPDPADTTHPENATALNNDFGTTFVGAAYKAAKTGDKEVTLTLDAQPTTAIVIGTTTIDVAAANNITSSWGNASQQHANTLTDPAVKITATDVTNPTLTAAAFNDTDNNGVDAGDKLILTFSEAITVGAVAVSDFALNGVSMTNATFAKSAFDSKQLDITLAANSSIAANATIDIRGFGTANITDAVGNKAMNLSAPLTIANVSVTDTTAPQITALTITSAEGTVIATITQGVNGSIAFSINGLTQNFTTGTATISEDVAIAIDAPGTTYDINVPGIGVTTTTNLVSLILSLVQDSGATGIAPTTLRDRLNGSTITLTDKSGNVTTYAINIAN